MTRTMEDSDRLVAEAGRRQRRDRIDRWSLRVILAALALGVWATIYLQYRQLEATKQLVTVLSIR